MPYDWIQGVYKLKDVAIKEAQKACMQMRVVRSVNDREQWSFFVVEQLLDIPGVGNRVFSVDHTLSELTDFPWSVTELLHGHQKVHME